MLVIYKKRNVNCDKNYLTKLRYLTEIANDLLKLVLIYDVANINVEIMNRDRVYCDCCAFSFCLSVQENMQLKS